jgi:hypothetical protein
MLSWLISNHTAALKLVKANIEILRIQNKNFASIKISLFVIQFDPK